MAVDSAVTIVIIGHDARAAIGLAIDGDGQRGVVGVTIAVGNGVLEHFLANIAILERIDLGTVVQLIGIAAIRLDGQGAVLTIDLQHTTPDIGSGFSRIVVAGDAGDRGQIRSDLILTAARIGDDVADQGSAILINAAGIRVGNRGGIGNQDHQIGRGGRIATLVGHGNREVIGDAVITAAVVLVIAGLLVFIGHLAGVRVIASQGQGTFSAGDGYRVAGQVGQLCLCHCYTANSDFFQAIRRGNSELTGHRRGGVLGNAVVADVQAVVIGSIQVRRTIGTAIDGDSQVCGIAVAVTVGQGVGKYILQIDTIFQRVDVRVVIVQFVGVETVWTDGQLAVLAFDHQIAVGQRSHVAAGRGAADLGDRGAISSLGISLIACRSAGATDDVAGDRQLIFGDDVGVIHGHRYIVDDVDHQVPGTRAATGISDYQRDSLGAVAAHIRIGRVRRGVLHFFQLAGELQFTLGRYAIHRVSHIEAGQGQLALGRVDLDMGGGIIRVQRCQLGQIDRHTTQGDALQAIRCSDSHAAIVDVGAVGASQATLMHGDMPLASDIRRHVRTIDILGHDGRRAIGVAIDGDGQGGGIVVAVDIGQGIAELVDQCLAGLERIDLGIVVVQRIGVAAVRADGQGAELTLDHQVTISIGGGGAGRVVLADNGGDRGAVGALGIGHIASRTIGNDIPADRNSILGDFVGIVTGYRGVVDDADDQVLAVAVGIPVIDGDADAFVGRVAIATGVIRRAGQGVFVVDGNAAIGIWGVAVEEQLAVFGGDGLVVVEQVFHLGLAQGQAVARHLDGDGGGVIQAVQRAQSEAGYNSGVIRIGRRATSQTAFEHHMIIDVAPRRVIRVGRIVDCRVVGVSRIVRVRYGDRDAVIAAVDSDGQGRSGLVAIGIGDGVGEGVGQRRIIRVQPLYRQVAVVQLVAVAAIGIQHQGAVVTNDIAGHTAIGHVAARSLIASGDTGYSGTVGTLGISHITRRAVGDDVAGHRNGGIFSDAVGIVAGHRSIVDDPDHQILAVSIIRMMGIAIPDGDIDSVVNMIAPDLRRTLQRIFIVDADGAIGVQGVAVEYQLAVLGIHGLVVAAQLFDLFFAQVQGAAFTIDIGVGQHQPLTAVQAVRCVDGEAGFDLEVGLV